MALTQIKTLQSGTGAVHRTLNDTLSDIYSVKDFGATGDGSTDDRAAIQAAITAAQATGGTVYIPEGEYKIKLRTVGGFNQRYTKKYPTFHRGMLWI